MKRNLTPYRNDIQALRGIAVVSVLLFHAKQSIFPLGFLGVDIFFVISGFVVTPLILRIFPRTEEFDKKETLNRIRAFYIRRFFRLAPALGSTLILTILLVLLFSPSWDNRNFPNQGIATLLLVGNWGAFAFVGDYFQGSASPLVHTWSLSAEEQIYILIPLIICIASLFSRRFRKFSILSVILLTGVAALIMQFLIQTYSPKYLGLDADVVKNALFYSPISRVWEFSLGTLAYALSSQRMHEIEFKKNPRLFVFLGLGTISGVCFLLSNPYPLFATLTALTVIYSKALLCLPKPIQAILSWIGDRSYSIYLVHLPLIYVANNTPLFGDSRRQVVTGLALVSTILIGSVMFSWVENRFRITGNISILKKNNITKTFAIFVLVPLISFFYLI